jgi:hypothetical protein
VIASNDGGLPETDCGAVEFVTPDNAEALAWGIHAAMRGGPLPSAGRHNAGTRFTVSQSVDTLLEVFARPQATPPATIVQQLEELVLAPSAEEPQITIPFVETVV